MKQLPLQNQLSPRQKMIRDVLQKNGNTTNRELMKKCSGTFGNISRMTIIRDLNDLVRMRYATRSGRGRSVTYQAQKMAEVKRWRGAIPPFLKKYFWDTDVRKLSLKKHSTYIIERVLEWGNLDAVKWLRDMYPERMIISVLGSSRRISDRSWNFWKLIFSHHNFLPSCIRRSSKKTQEKIWKY